VNIPEPCRVLLIDNDETSAARSVEVLRRWRGDSLQVAWASTMADGLTSLARGGVDVLITDWHVADGPGVAGLERLREAAPGTPILLYTASINAQEAITALRAGVVELLAKDEAPVESLPRAVQCALERHRHVATLEAARHEAAHRATHDPLTGLANRELFLEHLERELAVSARHARQTGLLFVDLDGFKEINDSCGHSVGDEVLRDVAHRLNRCVRRSDLVARLGGDEFVILVPDVASRDDLSSLREAVEAALRSPIASHAHPLIVDASVGAALFPADGHSPRILLEAADAAMYRVKARRSGPTRQRREPLPMEQLPPLADYP
jgi:diguanylate cyclase (GGDEF)-like protein